MSFEHKHAQAIADELVEEAIAGGAAELSLRSLRISRLPTRLSALAPTLKKLDLENCWRLQDLTPVAGLGGLTQLNLSGCDQLSDLAPLAGLGELTHLDLSRCQQLSDLKPLSGLGALTQLDLSSCFQLNDPSPLARLSGLTQLNLSGWVQLSDLTPLAGLSGLTQLHLNWCQQLSDLTVLAGLSALTQLHLGWCRRLVDLTALTGLSGLMQLNLSECYQLSDLTPLAGLSGLAQLNLSGCPELGDLGPLAGLIGLTQLDLSSFDRLTDLTPLAGLSKLTDLRLREWRQLSNITPLVGLSGLTLLHLTWCQELSDLTPLAGLSGLRQLHLSECHRLSDLTPLAGLSELTQLHLGGCHQLSDLTPLACLSGLTQLNLSDCHQLGDLSPLAGLSRLTQLHLIRFHQLSDLTPLAGLLGLTHLDLSWCHQLNDLIPVAGLSRLAELDLSCCVQLSDLTPLAGLSGLTQLDLSGCDQLTDLTPLAGLSQLTQLNLSYCGQLCDLAPLSGLAHLEDVEAAGSPIDLRPAALVAEDLPRLCYLAVDGAQGAPRELMLGAYHNSLPILEPWMVELQSGHARHEEVKLLVLGNGRIGKTQVVRRLQGLGFDVAVPTTHGVQVHEFGMRPRSEESGEVTVQTWDFGGQDVYLGTHSLFLDDRAVYLLAWTPGSENDHEVLDGDITVRNRPLGYWLAYIRSLAGSKAPVVVVQTQCDWESDVREPSIPVDHGFSRLQRTACSAKVSDGMDRLWPELRAAVRYQRERLSEVLMPTSWLRVNDELRQRRDHGMRVMSLDDYRSLCVNHSGVAAPNTLLAYLSAAGQVFWRDGAFDSQVVLDQAWALEGVYALLQRRNVIPFLRRHGGRFARQDLDDLLWHQQYGVAEQLLFIELMERCGVCFEVAPGHFIAPDCLPEREHVQDREMREWRVDEAEVKVRLNYSFLHDGSMRALLCAVGNRAGVDAVYWRYGCCVFDGQTRRTLRMNCELQSVDPALGQPGSVILEAAGPGALELIEHLLKSIERADAVGGSPSVCWERGRVEPEEGRKEREPEKRPADLDPFSLVPRARPGPQQASDALPVVYVSYAWGGDSDILVNGLAELLLGKFDFRRDRSVMRSGDSIRGFEREIGRAPVVAVVLSAKYMKSVDCMRELTFMYQYSMNEGDDFSNRVLPLVLDDAGIGSQMQRLDHVQHWIQLKMDLEAKVTQLGVAACGQTTVRELQDIAGFQSYLVDALTWLADRVMPRGFANLRANDYEAVVELLNRRAGRAS